jgi:hypothetical protein
MTLHRSSHISTFCSRTVTALTVGALVFGASLFSQAGAGEPPLRVSGPYVYENLDIYLIHGPDRITRRTLVPLGEALARKLVVVRETGTVSELSIENTSDQEVYVQAGDIVKGGKQDRVMGKDLVLQPRSGRVPIASFCVEHGRWRQRGQESSAQFTSSLDNAAHKDLKLANYQGSQAAVWENVGKVQARLNSNLGTDVRARESASSLQLSLENDRVRTSVEGYMRALTPVVEGHSDAVGYAFAVNGMLSSADIYASRALFSGLWSRLLRASAIEAIADRKAPAPHTPPSLEAVRSFLADAQSGQEKPADAKAHSVVRETASALFVETKDGAPEAWIHRSYVHK